MVRVTAYGNLILHPGELTTQTADLTTSNTLWNSVVSTECAEFAGADIKNFYIETQYNLNAKAEPRTGWPIGLL